jgi:spermidine synthase
MKERTALHTTPGSGWLQVDFAVTILMSAFLLFQVQPLISKVILPWFGGSPAVWTTCMLFFQVVLFGGYAYAHLVTRLLSPRWQGVVHLVLLALALAALPIAPNPSWKPDDASSPTLRILLLLAANVGMPYFVLSSTGPLVQAWFARACPGRSPYRLYALSNLGSLLALLSYPFVFEPVLDVLFHTKLWSMGFALFVIPCGIGALGLRSRASAMATPAPASVQTADEARPTVGRRALWLALPACATLMLLATTNHVCQEVAVIPFLWVVPLSLYLISFIITFDHERWYLRRVFAVLTAVLSLAVAGIHPLARLLDRVHYNLGFPQQAVLYFAALFSICMLCHGELVRRRPGTRYLTEFYLMVSAGGALGGVLVSLVSPAIFTTFFEWKVGLLTSFLLGAVIAVREIGQQLKLANRYARVVLLLPVAAGVGCVGVFQSSGEEPLDISRNFYGVVWVGDADEDIPEDHYRAMIHGATVHGRQYQAAGKRLLPISYYSPESGVGQALQHLKEQGPLKIGAVGLGVGTLAAYARAQDRLTFYELNADVETMARKHFSYLRDCPGQTKVVLGDARLSLEREEPQGYDALVLDAFTGDAPPAHLLTEEAFAIYLRHLQPDGVLALHITNRRVDLMPVVDGLADRFGLNVVRILSPWNGDKLLFRSDWVMLTRNIRFVAAVPSVPPPESKKREKVLWTDHYNNLFALLR